MVASDSGKPVDVKSAKILVADDHELVRKGVRTLLEKQSGWQVIGEAVHGREAVELCSSLKPEIAILDISMPELNGLEACRQILKADRNVQVLILTMYDSEQLVREVLRAGARGYVLKSDAGQNLVAAIEALLEKRVYFTSRVSEILMEGYLHGSPAAELERPTGSVLTSREIEIVQLLAEGNSNKEAAARLNISVKTVETHRSRIMEKLRLNSFSELVRFAIRNNIVGS